MQKIGLVILVATLLAGCGKKPNLLDIPPAPPNVQQQPLPPQQPSSDLMTQQRVYSRP